MLDKAAEARKMSYARVSKVKDRDKWDGRTEILGVRKRQ